VRRLARRVTPAVSGLVTVLAALGIASVQSPPSQPAGPVLAGPVIARPGPARLGPARLGPARRGPARPEVASLTAQTCPAATHPGNGSTQPYRLAFTGTLAGTLRITKSPAGPITLPQITGTFCGLLELPLERASVAPHDLDLSPVTVRIARANVPAHIGGDGVTVGLVGTSPAANGGLNLTLAAPVGARTGLFGVSCLLPVNLRLSTTAPGGSPLVGPLTDAQATITQSGFAIGPAVSTGTAGTCPSYLAAQVDHLLDLPNANTTSTVGITLDVTIP
jgi:hypothetical protein